MHVVLKSVCFESNDADRTFAEVCSNTPRPNADTSTDTEAWEDPEAAIWTPRWNLTDGPCTRAGLTPMYNTITFF